MAVPGLDNTVQIATGDRHSLCLAAGARVCGFDVNSYGELGHGTVVYRQRLSPAIIGGLAGIVQVAVGYDFSLCLPDGGKVYAFGHYYGQRLGLPRAYEGVPTSTLVPRLENIIQAAAGYSHSLCLAANGSAYGLGNNSSGQLGLGWTPDYEAVTLIPGINSVARVATGTGEPCCLSADGRVYRLETVATTDWGWGVGLVQTCKKAAL